MSPTSRAAGGSDFFAPAIVCEIEVDKICSYAKRTEGKRRRGGENDDDVRSRESRERGKSESENLGPTELKRMNPKRISAAMMIMSNNVQAVALGQLNASGRSIDTIQARALLPRTKCRRRRRLAPAK